MKEFDRLAARLLVVAPTGRALLLRIEPDFRAPFWVTPGGGLDEGETLEAAALRELAEEVGRADLPLGPCVWLETVTFTWGEWLVRQEQSTFLVHASEEFEPVIAHPDAEPITGGAWFDRAELDALREPVYPETLGGLLAHILRHGPPVVPIQLAARRTSGP